MPAALSVTHLDMHTAPVEPVLTVVALNHEGVVVFATADAVRLQRLRQPIHEFAICEVDFDLACLLFQTFQNLSTHNPVEMNRVLRCILVADDDAPLSGLPVGCLSSIHPFRATHTVRGLALADPSVLLIHR